MRDKTCLLGANSLRRVKMGHIVSPLTYYVTTPMDPNETAALAEMEKSYTLKPPLHYKSFKIKLRKGQKVVISLGHGQWNRAKIKGPAPSAKIEVIFIDTGEIDDTISYDDIYELTQPWSSIPGSWRKMEIEGLASNDQVDICGLALVHMFFSNANGLWAVIHSKHENNARIWRGNFVAHFSQEVNIGCTTPSLQGYVSLIDFLAKEGIAAPNEEILDVTCSSEFS